MTTAPTVQAIETRYAGYRFRSRLEARWGVFLDHLGIRWEYEPQGYLVDGRPYLPDFLLTELGTWVEVKGAEEKLDRHLMQRASVTLPSPSGVAADTPRLLILGPIPREPSPRYDLGWIGISGFDHHYHGECINDGYWGFGSGTLKRVDASTATDVQSGGPWLTPATAVKPTPTACLAYQVARMARFEFEGRA